MSESDIFGLSRIFQIILDYEQTGTLRVQKDEKEMDVYFEKGKIKLVASPHKRSVLAEALMRSDRLEKETVEAIFAKQREKKKPLPVVLREMDLPDPRFKEEGFITQICSTQIGEDIYEILGWPEVHCEFMENHLLENVFEKELLELPIALDPNGLVIEAARRQDEWKLIREVLPSNKDIPYLAHPEREGTGEEKQQETDAQIQERIAPLIEELGNFDTIVSRANLQREEAIQLMIKLIRSGKVTIKKAKELKRVVVVIGLVKDLKDVKDSLEAVRLSYDEAVNMFISLANEEKINLDSSEELQRVLNILGTVNGMRDFNEILEMVRMAGFEAMKIFAALTGPKGRIRLKNAQELKQMSNLDVLRKDTFKCIKLYERVEELGLKNFETMNWLSKAYETSGLTNKAVEKYRELGTSALDNNLYEEAVRAYKKVVQFAPEDLEAYERLINAYNKCGQREKAAEVSAIYARRVAVFDKRKAIMVLDEANKSFPASPSNLELMATLYLEMNDKENAILTYNILANLMKKQKDVEKTLDAYRKILSLDSTNLKAHLELAKGLISIENIPDGVSQYKELGKLLIQTVKADSSNDEMVEILINVCECIIRYEPNNVMAREWLVDTYIARKDERTALNILRELLGLLQKEEDTPKLISNLRKVVAMDPDDFRCRKMLADTLLTKGERNSAINEYMQLGLSTYQKNDMRKAKEAFEAILNIDPFNFIARQKRASIFTNLNIHVRAVEEYKLVGYLAKSVGMIPEAVEAFSKVAELASDKELWCFTEVARLCEFLEENKKAISYYKSYASKCIARGNYGEVNYACSRVILMDPEDEEALKMKELAESKMEILRQYIDNA